MHKEILQQYLDKSKIKRSKLCSKRLNLEAVMSPKASKQIKIDDNVRSKEANNGEKQIDFTNTNEEDDLTQCLIQISGVHRLRKSI